MHPRDLDTFLHVAENQSVSRTATALHLTQPAVTKRIQNLEDDLGTPLFDRVGKRLQLTAAGKTLVPSAQRILSAMQDARAELANLADQVAGRLTLATSHHIGLHRLGPVLRAFRERHPQVQLDISFEDSEVAHELVRSGEIEIAVATLNPAGAEDLAVAPVWADPLVFVADAPPPAEAPLSLAALAALPSVLPGTSTYTGRIVLELFREAGVQLTPTMVTNYLETLAMLVRAGLGWSVLPRSMAGDLPTLTVASPPLERTLGLLTNPQRSASNAARAFRDVLMEFAEA